jgi:sulfonate transport system permease protein
MSFTKFYRPQNVIPKIIRTAQNTIFNLSWINSVYLKVLVPVTLLVLWEVACREGFLKPLILPAPTAIAKAFVVQIESGDLFRDIGISLLRIIQGYAIGAFFGLTIGILIGIFKRIDQATSVVLSFLRPIPIFAWLPVIILWLGIDEITKVIIIALGCFWPILLNVIAGIKNVDKKYLEVARILEKNRYQTLIKVVFPSALPSIFTGLRIGIGMAWMCVVAAEMIAATSGIGFLISYSREMLQPDVMFVGVFSIGIVGLIIDRIFKLLEQHFIKWNANMKRQ